MRAHRAGGRCPSGRLGIAESAWFGVFLSVRGHRRAVARRQRHRGGRRRRHAPELRLRSTRRSRRARRSSTLVGAVPGALPPVIGWSAATGDITLPALVLFGIVFFWQMPHFLAIAWMYRDDYARAGIPLLPVIEPDGRRTGRQALLYATALWPVSLLPAVVGLAGLALQRRRDAARGRLHRAQRRVRARPLAGDGAPSVLLLDHLPAAAARRARRRPALVVARLRWSISGPPGASTPR